MYFKNAFSSSGESGSSGDKGEQLEYENIKI
jgi:hypothetical protein